MIHRRWCQKNMPTCINSIITRTYRSWIIHFAIKRRRDNVKKTTENVNENPIGNEIVTSDQLVNAMPGTFSDAKPRCTLYYKLYLFCKENNRRLEFNDTVFLGHLSVLKATKPGVIGLYIQQPNSLGHPGPLCTINV